MQGLLRVRILKERIILLHQVPQLVVSAAGAGGRAGHELPEFVYVLLTLAGLVEEVQRVLV